MKNVIVAVLLIAATGAGIYFLFFNKKKSGIAGNEIQKELIVGKWKLDSLSQVKDSAKLFTGLAAMIDSNFKNYTYQFRKDGKVLRFLKDNVQKDSSRYEWTDKDHLLFKEQIDSTGTNFIVSKLNKDGLVLELKDSSVAYFTKLK